MSQEQPETPTPQEKKTVAAGKASKPRNWKRRVFRAILAFLVIVLVIRIGLFLMLSVTLRKVANFYDLDLTYERQQITLLGGQAALWGVQVARRGESTPFLEADYAHGNLSVLALLRANIEIWRLEADGVTLDVTRTADGKIPLMDLVLAHLENTPVKPESETEEPLELNSPFKIDALRLHRFRARVTDLAMHPDFHETFHADVRLSDLRNPEKPTRIEADIWSDSILSAMRIYGTGTAEGRVVKLDADFRGSGLNLLPLANYLQPLGLSPVARSIDWSGKLKLSTDAGPTPTSITADLRLSDIRAEADLSEVVSVKGIHVSAKSAGAEGVALSDLTVDGVRVHADRSREGRLRFAGIEFVSPEPSTQPTVRQVQLAPASRATTLPTAKPFFLTLDTFGLKGLELSFGDKYLDQPATLSVLVDELKTGQISRDASGRVVVPVKGTLRAPGIAEAIAIDGSVQPFQKPYEFSATLSAQHITPDAIKPYLAPLGLSATLNDATLSGSLLATALPTATGGVEASVKLSELVLQDATTRLAMPLMRVDGVKIEPSQSSILVSDTEIVGPELSGSREADGSLRGLGMKYLAIAPAAPKPVPTTRPVTHLVELPVLPSLPRIEIQRLKWSGAKIDLADNAMTPSRTFSLTDVGADLENVVIDMSDRPGESRGGRIKGHIASPGLVNKFDIAGTFERVPNRTSINVDVSGSGLKGVELAPYFAPLGFVPQLSDGAVNLTLGVDLKLVNQVLSADLLATNLSLREGETEIAGVKLLRVEQLGLSDGAIASKAITIEAPTVRATRLKDGAFESSGVRVIPAQVDAESLPLYGPVLPVPYSPVSIRVGELKVTGATVGWTDQMPHTEVSLTLRADAELSNVALSLPGDPARFGARGSIDGVAKSFSATGEIDLDPSTLFFSGDIQASGITGTAIDGYLPPGSKTTFSDASFSAKASLSVLPVGESGQKLALSLRDLKLAQADVALASVAALTVDAPLIDMDQNVVQVQSLVVDRAAIANVRIMNDGTIDLPGLSVGPPPVEAAPAESTPTVVSADATVPDGDQIAQRLAAARKPLPLLTIETVDLGLEQAGVELEVRQNAAPIALKNLRLTNRSPIQVGGAKAAELPPVDLRIQTELAPLVKQVALEVSAAPFATEATVNGELRADQINGQGLLDLVPEIAGLVDGSSLTNGSFKSTFDATLRIKRTRPTDFDLRRGFEGEVHVKDVAYSPEPGTEPLAGVELISLEGLRVNEAFNGGSVKLLTINNPSARILRDVDGIHVLGWTIKLPGAEAATRPAVDTQSAEGESIANETVTVTTPKPADPPPPGPEFKIDKLLVSGSDVLIRDTSVEPALVVPINALDVEVKGLSNRMLVEPDRPVRFSVLVGADKVELPTRARRGDTTSAETEMRPLLSQVTATGKISFYPTLDGYAKASVNGFEMQSLTGEAKAFGITLGDGIFDGTFDARFREGGNLDLKTKLVVTDLKMSEQPNGPVQTRLGLQAPIDAVIGLVEDPSGAITFPLNVPIRAGEVNFGSVYGSIVGGVAQVCATAIVSQPAKMLQGLLGGEQQAQEPKPPIVISFIDGDVSLESTYRSELDKLIVEMRKDPNLVVTLTHRLSGEDARRAAILASPTPEQIEQMTSTLRMRRMTLINERAVYSAGVATELGSGGTSAQSLAELRAIDQKIVANDDALERLLDLTRPGADLQAGRRMKAAALDIASARLNAVKSYLETAGMKERVSVVNARFEVDESLEQGGTVTVEQTVKKRAQ